MIELLREQYGLEVLEMERSGVGAGSDTWFVTCRDGKYVVKYPAVSEINHPEQEPQLCDWLLERGIPVCRFLKNREGQYLSKEEGGRVFHMQEFFDGKQFELNTAPQWLLTESARMLGRIHTELKHYSGLPEGIGAGFFRYMTPENALRSYQHSLEIAREQGDETIVSDLLYRIELIQRFPVWKFDLDKLTCSATHGDYFISQILCEGEKIQAVIDWTTACVHPVVWEIFRSYVYAAPECARGIIDADSFIGYVEAYNAFAPLNEYDIQCMVRLFYYQIAVCDYYGQYYGSEAANRHIYLHQAMFSTGLLHWLEKNEKMLTDKLIAVFCNQTKEEC